MKASKGGSITVWRPRKATADEFKRLSYSRLAGQFVWQPLPPTLHLREQSLLVHSASSSLKQDSSPDVVGPVMRYPSGADCINPTDVDHNGQSLSITDTPRTYSMTDKGESSNGWMVARVCATMKPFNNIKPMWGCGP